MIFKLFVLLGFLYFLFINKYKFNYDIHNGILSDDRDSNLTDTIISNKAQFIRFKKAIAKNIVNYVNNSENMHAKPNAKFVANSIDHFLNLKDDEFDFKEFNIILILQAKIKSIELKNDNEYIVNIEEQGTSDYVYSAAIVNKLNKDKKVINKMSLGNEKPYPFIEQRVLNLNTLDNFDAKANEL